MTVCGYSDVPASGQIIPESLTALLAASRGPPAPYTQLNQSGLN